MVDANTLMFRRRGENLHSIFIFLFLNIAFYFLEHQDESRFAALFSFDGKSFASGQWWRVITYQFTQAGEGWSFIPKPVFLFFTLLILYFMGAALEEEWGTASFVAFFLVSTFATAGLAAWLGVPMLLGSFFVRYTLLFVYASIFSDQTFYLFAFVPIRVRWLAYITAGLLVYGAAFGGVTNVAVLGGAVAGYVFYLLSRAPASASRKGMPQAAKPVEAPAQSNDFTAVRNAARFVGIKKALAARSDEELDRIVGQCAHETIAGVNICPPVDYKPEANDGYCIRCEGFAECSARYIRMNRPHSVPANAIPEASS